MHTPDVTEYTNTNANTTLIREYVSNMTTYMILKHPEMKKEDVTAKIQAYVLENIVRPRIKMMAHDSYGSTEMIVSDLLTYTGEILGKRVITPFGTTYKLSSEIEAFIKKLIKNELKQRGIVKKDMLDNKAKGNMVLANIQNSIQSRIKIGVNSISGAMGSAHNCLFDPAGYNAITSTCRHGCMTGYAHAERFIEGNFYFPDYESVINWCIICIRTCPDKDTIMDTLSHYNLKHPTIEEVYIHLKESLSLYTFNYSKEDLTNFISQLQDHERAFIYYVYNLKNLLRENPDISKPIIADIYNPIDMDNIDESIVAEDLYKIDGDLVVMVVSTNPDLLEGHLVYDTVKDAPHISKRVVHLCRHIEKKLSYFQKMFDVFIHPKIDVQDVTNHKNMMRKTVILSDTDSVIASTKNWVEWYTGKIVYNKDAYDINFFVIYMLTKSLLHIFAVMGNNLGVIQEDLRLINMKNEFFYPILTRTPIGKHYSGLNTIVEGRWLKKPDMDLKGKNFRGSDLCATTLKTVETFIREKIFNKYIENGHLHGGDIVDEVLKFEYSIIDSIKAGDTTFFGTSPINPRSAYAKPESSPYFYYLLWQSVFKDKYGEMHLPQKYRKIPLDPQLVKSQAFMDKFKSIDNETYDKFVAFLKEWPKKKITQLYIPLNLDLPLEIIDAINMRSILHKNTYPIYLILCSLGIGVWFKNSFSLLSDMYEMRY